jgi:hypothetical protein
MWQGVPEIKEHDSWFKETEGSDECCLPAVLRSDQHIIVSPAYVHFGKNTWSSKVIYEVRDERKRVCIFDHVGIDILVVLTGMYQSILLGNEEEWWCLGELGWLDLACGKMFVHKALASLMLLWIQEVQWLKKPSGCLDVFH